MIHRLLAAVAAVSLVACASADGTDKSPTPTTKPGDTNPTPTTDPNAALDPVDDPVPAGLPALTAYSKEKGVELPVDLSCFAKPMTISNGAPASKEFHLIELGGADTDRVG